MKLRLLLPSIALIVVATMVPAGLRHPSLNYIAYNFDPSDFLNNIFLYIPLGIALCGTSVWRAFTSGFCLATTAEILQIGYIDRVPSPFDVTSNTCGAVIGYLAAVLFLRATGYNPRSLPIPRRLAAAAMAVAILGAIALVHYRPRHDFSNWIPDAHLAVGFEPEADFAWDGSVSQVQVYPFAMPATRVDNLRCGATLPSGGLLNNIDMTVPYGRPILSPADERHLYDALTRQSQLTLLVCLTSHNVEQNGLARIVTYSRSRGYRNFTLGEFGDTLNFRLRTPASGENGNNPALHSGPVLVANQPAFVAAVYDGRISRMYVNGELAAHADIGARRPHLPKIIYNMLPQPLPIREIELGGAEAILSGLLTVAILGYFGVPGRLSMRALAGIGAGFLIGGLVWVIGVSQPHLGLRILAESAAAGLIIGLSMERPPASG